MGLKTLTKPDRLQFAHDILTAKPQRPVWLGDFVYIIEDVAEEWSEGGIFIPEQAQDRPQTGTIVAMGYALLHDKDGEKDRRIQGAQIGDDVVFNKWNNAVIQVPWPGHESVNVTKVHISDVYMVLREINETGAEL